MPFIVFAAVAVLLWSGLGKDPGRIPSPFIDKPAPAFALPSLGNADEIITHESMQGEVWLLNVWASWCVACLDEHPLLLDVSEKGQLPIVGLNYKDAGTDAVAWLARHGNPYTAIAVDHEGDTGIDYGVYGVPETFLIDKQGFIRIKHIGPVTRNDMESTILPAAKQLQQSSP